MKQAKEKKEEKVKYSGLLLVDILNLDYKNFFTTYRTDVFGFLAVFVIIILMILGLIVLAGIGA